MMPAQKPGRSKQDYETPREFIEAVEKRWGKLDIDLAANRTNAKADSYFTPEQDSLKQIWSTLSGNLWLNPPFGRIAPWVAKCADASSYAPPNNWRLFLLVPASIGSNWFVEDVHD